MRNNRDLTNSLPFRYFNRFGLLITTGIIVFEVETISPLILFALAASLLSLGIVYWLMDRSPSSDSSRISAE